MWDQTGLVTGLGCGIKNNRKGSKERFLVDKTRQNARIFEEILFFKATFNKAMCFCPFVFVRNAGVSSVSDFCQAFDVSEPVTPGIRGQTKTHKGKIKAIFLPFLYIFSYVT